MIKTFQYYKQHFVIMLYIVVFIVCFGLAALLMTQGTSNKFTLPFGNQQAQQPQQSLMNSASAQQPTEGARMVLSTVDGGISYTTSEQITLEVTADSNNTSITGFDTLFLFDPTSISVVKVTSLDPAFDVFTFNNSGYVSITATKKLNVSTPAVLSNSKVISVVVQAKKAGMTPVLIAPQLGRERTKFVDDQATIITPQLGQALQLNIQ